MTPEEAVGVIKRRKPPTGWVSTHYEADQVILAEFARLQKAFKDIASVGESTDDTSRILWVALARILELEAEVERLQEENKLLRQDANEHELFLQRLEDEEEPTL